jgi:hypothetical protein
MADDAAVIWSASTQDEQDDCQKSECHLNVLAVDFGGDHQDLREFGFHVFFLFLKEIWVKFTTGEASKQASFRRD